MVGEDAENAEKASPSRKRKADEAFNNDAQVETTDVGEEKVSSEQPVSQKDVMEGSINEGKDTTKAESEESVQAKSDVGDAGNATKPSATLEAEPEAQSVQAKSDVDYAANATKPSEIPEKDKPAGDEWVAPAPPSVSDWVPPPPPAINPLMSAMGMPGFPAPPGALGTLPLPPLPQLVLGEDGLPVPPAIPNLVPPPASDGLPVPPPIPNLVPPPPASTPNLVPAPPASPPGVLLGSTVPGSERSVEPIPPVSPPEKQPLPKVKATGPSIISGVAPAGVKMEWTDYEAQYLKYMKQLQVFGEWLDSPETRSKLGNSAPKPMAPIIAPTLPAIAPIIAPTLPGKGAQPWNGPLDLLTGKSRVCVYFLNNACRQGANCYNKHPGEKEADQMRAEFKKKTCKFGEACVSDKCLFWHPNKG